MSTQTNYNDWYEKEIKAIHGSIAKHDMIAQGLKIDCGASDCPLCNEFYSEESGDCTLCPINWDGNHYCCTNTPYSNYPWARKDKYYRIGYAHFIEAEIEFLISLLPETEKQKYDLTKY